MNGVDHMFSEPLHREMMDCRLDLLIEQNVSISNAEMDIDVSKIVEIEVEVLDHVPYTIGMYSTQSMGFTVLVNAKEKL